MSSDEEDYMSDAFLKKCEDTRPGLLSKDCTRKLKSEAKHKFKNAENKVKRVKVLEAEKREEGLKKELGSENKGFAMLQKMGFKPGMALGKKGGGISEPVPIDVKSGRSGLGHEAEIHRKRNAMSLAHSFLSQKRAKMYENKQSDFVSRKRSDFVEKKIKNDLYKSQKVCAQLDAEQNYTEPEEVFFWPKGYLTQEEEEEEEDIDEHDEGEEEEKGSEEQLELLTYYLRNHHYYCLWCGTRYSNSEDLNDSCPGDTADDHD